MAASNKSAEPRLPWFDNSEDRNFRRLVIALLLLFMGLGLVLNSLTLPELKQKKLVDVSPRLAKLILEKQKVKPPPKKEIPKIEEKKKEVEQKKPEEKPPEKKKPPVKEVKQAAREIARQSGLIALSDELSDLRESFDLESLVELPQASGGKQAVEVASTSDLLTSQAKQSSGGITTNTLNRKIETSELATRKTTEITSKIESKQTTLAKAAPKSSSVSSRSAEEIEQVFQKNKSGIFSIYNRALRKNPSLQGKVVVELTISPAGTVSAVKILSSELGDAALERKLALKIRKFKFTSANVAEITVTYPIDFLPS